MSLLFDIIALLIAIVIISLPAYAASLIVVHKSTANFGNAIVVTLLTPIIIIFFSLGLHFVFAPLAALGSLLAFIITLVILLYVYSIIYDISIGRSFVLAIVEIIIWFIFFFITGILVALPGII
ncbi:hypothetical protein [Ferroplasma sp.]|uniref:hypothetical protein n=1 Tax=Ferroplasma sp. TaxID=2591003 RepID=UPI00261D382A|nr:hypothetical protein [Ferroplasma sp.]MCL4453597.1 hypothetical protein [Candidatus Thermoplasmatota archaeon]